MTGTKTNVANVAKESPQMTARASGAFCSSLANTERHGYHAQDHRACSHEHRPQSRKSRDLAATQELSLASIRWFANRHHRDAVCSRKTDTHQRRRAQVRLRQVQ